MSERARVTYTVGTLQRQQVRQQKTAPLRYAGRVRALQQTAAQTAVQSSTCGLYHGVANRGQNAHQTSLPQDAVP